MSTVVQFAVTSAAEICQRFLHGGWGGGGGGGGEGDGGKECTNCFMSLYELLVYCTTCVTYCSDLHMSYGG